MEGDADAPTHPLVLLFPHLLFYPLKDLPSLCNDWKQTLYTKKGFVFSQINKLVKLMTLWLWIYSHGQGKCELFGSNKVLDHLRLADKYVFHAYTWKVIHRRQKETSISQWGWLSSEEEYYNIVFQSTWVVCSRTMSLLGHWHPSELQPGRVALVTKPEKKTLPVQTSPGIPEQAKAVGSENWGKGLAFLLGQSTSKSLFPWGNRNRQQGTTQFSSI